ncbi:SDR family NAD(P)-dependent oxidoreductase [Actinokineospora terrae]|uniref:SDR family NAD(P)-dependent oxidoreductase n=1 Tax=Actinokineospora terrae TaxID=155974 RepID=UPI003CCBD2A2
MTTSSEKLVVVTGASTGMGAATARELARRGLRVLAGVRRDRDADAIRAVTRGCCTRWSTTRASR